MNRGVTVAVALSGGVDSSTAAALLLEDGRRVIAVTMLTGLEPPGFREAAARVAAHLGLEHAFVDVRRAFRERVVEPFCRAYLAGRTPNPCVGCNRLLKFGQLRRAARSLGADLLATGHYARVAQDAAGVRRLYRGVDPVKDQSYFLYALGQEDLAGVLFPLGGLTKGAVRRLAAEWGLPVSRRESQDACFVGTQGHVGLVEEEARLLAPDAPGLRPGPILDTVGRRLGTHRGLHRYTVGQRRGLGVGASEPLYVVALIPEVGAVVVGGADEVGSRWLEAEEASFVTGRPPGEGARVEAKVRYRARGALARLSFPSEATSGVFRLEFDEPQVAAPGQAVVLYEGAEVLGGGTIARTEASERGRSVALGPGMA
ncbi:MAG: tRNA 2-thiouridine(34) synthase MnmA [Firmicutes bacterium]|nr:tRNA 2-thiouridine(34) synthase MnmA [Bacillota bacterium]